MTVQKTYHTLSGELARWTRDIIVQFYACCPVDNFGTAVSENPDCLLLSGTVVGENPDHVCWVVVNENLNIMSFLDSIYSGCPIFYLWPFNTGGQDNSATGNFPDSKGIGSLHVGKFSKSAEIHKKFPAVLHYIVLTKIGKITANMFMMSYYLSLHGFIKYLAQWCMAELMHHCFV